MYVVRTLRDCGYLESGVVNWDWPTLGPKSRVQRDAAFQWVSRLSFTGGAELDHDGTGS
jgi:hypothetical protein